MLTLFFIVLRLTDSILLSWWWVVLTIFIDSAYRKNIRENTISSVKDEYYREGYDVGYDEAHEDAKLDDFDEDFDRTDESEYVDSKKDVESTNVDEHKDNIEDEELPAYFNSLFPSK